MNWVFFQRLTSVEKTRIFFNRGARKLNVSFGPKFLKISGVTMEESTFRISLKP